MDGDGRAEMVALNQNGNRLRVVKLDGQVLFERKVKNNGNWGTPLPCVVDLDGDGCAEVVVPDLAPGPFEAGISVFDACGERIAAHRFGAHERDDYGIAVPLLAPMRCRRQDAAGVFAALAGGQVVALDADMREIWRRGGFRHDYGHECHIGDVDGDGLDEVAFCTCDHINGGLRTGWNAGELVLLDHDGTTLMRRRVDDYCPDTHFDDIAIADFGGTGGTQILVEKGFLIDWQSDPPGEVVWDVSGQFGHGQWIAHLPNPAGRGRLAFVAELWGAAGGSALLDGEGKVVWDLSDLPRTRLDPGRFPGWHVLPTRCHVVQWTPDAAPEIFVGEQAQSPTSHDCFETRRFALSARTFDLQGNLLGTLPFPDAQVEGYWYNGEVRSRVADVDGDGRQEIVFPRQDGCVMVIAKHA
ncbi:MAG: VCBS repeat-containing protein [Anaerolineae bacterium]|nr:VCBS repeat-containing protein [Anaerolineae bacterium]